MESILAKAANGSMSEDSETDESPPSPRRARGRPRRDVIEKANLSKVLKSNVPKSVSSRFAQRMSVLKVAFDRIRSKLILEKAKIETQVI